MSQVKDFEAKTIKGVKYKVQLLGTSRALVISAELAKLSLPSIGAAVDGLFQEGIWEEKQTFSEVAILLTQQIGNFELVEIAQELLEGATADGVAIDYENYFKGRPELLIEILELSLRGNFGGLFMKMSLSKTLKTFIEEFKVQTQEQRQESEADQLKTPQSE